MVRNTSSSAGPEDAALQVAAAVLSKKSSYLEGLTRQFHPNSVDLAGRLSTTEGNGDLAQALGAYAADVDAAKNGGNAVLGAKMEAFLEEQRSRLKSHVVQNAKRQRDVEAFCGAVGAVRDDIRMKRQNVANTQLEDDEVDDKKANNILAQFDLKSGEGTDYEKTILDKMKERTTSGEDGGEEQFQSNAMVREMMQTLGEQVAAGSKTTGEDDDDDDDDLEMVGGDAALDANKLKCPITTMLLDQPLRNTVCNHVYSKAGIDQLLKGAGRRKVGCPVAGCTNGDLQRNQLVEDIQVGMLVKRYKAREERERRNKMSQMDDLDDDE